jgi:hypothetical protein
MLFFEIIRLLMIIFICLSVVLIASPAVGAIVVGNPQGAVTLTEVVDYQCEHCHRMQPRINWLMAHDSQLKIRLIPVAIINNNSLAEAASSYVMAKTTNHFLNYHNFLLSRAVNTRGVVGILNNLHLKTKTFRFEMHQPWVLKEMEAGLALLKQYHSGTPLILIYPSGNPKKRFVFRGESDLKPIIRAIKEAST